MNIHEPRAVRVINDIADITDSDCKYQHYLEMIKIQVIAIQYMQRLIWNGNRSKITIQNDHTSIKPNNVNDESDSDGNQNGPQGL